MERSAIRREVVFEESVPLELRLDGLDADRLRRLFSDLYDRAASAVNRAGFDLDDAVIENVLGCQSGETTVEVPIGIISDGVSLTRALRSALTNQSGITPDECEFVIRELRGRAVVERWETG